MIKSKQEFIGRVHLILSVLIVIPAALIYGFKPELIIDVNLTTIDEHSVFKAIMGIYLAFALLWFMGVTNTKYFKTALRSNMLFMMGLGLGRLLSMLIDGIPSTIYVLGTIGELVLGVYGIWVLSRKLV